MMIEILDPEVEFRIIRKNVIDKINLLSQLSMVIFVEDSKGKINSTRTIKVKNIIRNIEDSVHYELKRHRIQTKSINSSIVTISDLMGEKTVCSKRTPCSCLYDDLFELFIQEMKSVCKIERSSFNYFKRNSIISLFIRRNPEELVNKIISLSKNFSWIIVPESIFSVIEKSKKFNRLENNTGRLGDINVFVNKLEKENIIYFGNYESITIIVNKNIDYKLDEFSKLKNTTIFVDYIFIENTSNIQSLFIT